MINEIKEYFRYRLYDNSRILVNDLKDVIEEVQSLLENKVYTFLKDVDERIIIEDIEIVYENEKIVWRIVDANELNGKPTIYLNTEELKDKFISNEYMVEFKEKKNDYPKELFGVSFISFMETLNHFIYKDDLIGKPINVFNICMISDNGKNNIVYELQ